MFKLIKIIQNEENNNELVIEEDEIISSSEKFQEICINLYELLEKEDLLCI